MNETGDTAIWTSICWIVAIILYVVSKAFRKRRAASVGGTSEEL